MNIPSYKLEMNKGCMKKEIEKKATVMLNIYFKYISTVGENDNGRLFSPSYRQKRKGTLNAMPL